MTANIPVATPNAPGRSLARRRLAKLTPGRVLAWAILLAALALTIFPFLWMIRTAFSNGRSLFTEPGSSCPWTRPSAPSSACWACPPSRRPGPKAAPAPR